MKGFRNRWIAGLLIARLWIDGLLGRIGGVGLIGIVGRIYSE